MFDWLFASPVERRILGATSRRAPTPWVIAIMTFTIMLMVDSPILEGEEKR